MPRSPIPAWHAEAYARRRPHLLKRARIVAAIRAWFLDRGFVEVETPALQVSPGLEPHLKAFPTTLEAPGGATSRLYLHTSPEFAMKKLLAAGEKRIFQMARVFRNGERSATHHPEFTMLEWYRAGEGYERLMEDCEGLVRAAAGAAGSSSLLWRGRAAGPAAPFERLTVAEAFRRHAGIDPFAFLPAPGRFDAEGFAKAARGIGVTVAADDGWDDVFFKVFLDRIEPKLGHPRPTLLADYPIHMAALSRPKADAPHLAERFELYIAGLELANAFGELTDASEQRRRFEADMKLKQRLYGTRYPIDEDFLSALAAMPEASGIALGLDRLVMLATGAETIEEVLWLPVAEEGT
ncbi:MAG: EF-P lysine aminoacylase GenX [Alphaproteobacteria bacterium]|nr:EF-P lysine aminoacylase GenX [Alphaproteobacteria bacterium]